MIVILDTHTWIWWVNESNSLSKKAQKHIDVTEFLGVSVISCWEVAMLVEKQRIGLNMDVVDWIELALERPKVKLLPIDPKIAVLATRLPGKFHSDPADRFIVATCLKHSASLISKDQTIHDWGQIEVIW